MAAVVPAIVVLPVSGSPDVHLARRATRGLVGEVGFDWLATEEIALVAVELASNLVRHATHGGTLTLRPIDSDLGVGIEIASIDAGPGIDDIEVALRDGTSTAGGLGGGLSTVRRLMDELSVTSTGNGTLIHARRWKRAS